MSLITMMTPTTEAPLKSIASAIACQLFVARAAVVNVHADAIIAIVSITFNRVLPLDSKNRSIQLSGALDFFLVVLFWFCFMFAPFTSLANFGALYHKSSGISMF